MYNSYVHTVASSYYLNLIGLSYQVTLRQKSQNMAKKLKSKIPESYRPFVSGHCEPKRVKIRPRSQTKCYPSLIGLFRTRSQLAKTSPNTAKKPN